MAFRRSTVRIVGLEIGTGDYGPRENGISTSAKA